MEIQRVQNDCNLADIDFEFVIDSSGSVGQANWQITMDYIAQYWIQGQSYVFYTLKTIVLDPIDYIGYSLHSLDPNYCQ